MEIKISYSAGYKAMFFFLDKYWRKTNIDDLGGLLGSMDFTLTTNRDPMDVSMYIYWLDAVKKDNILNEEISLHSGLAYIIDFLERAVRELTLNLENLVDDLKDMQDNGELTKELWTMWIDSFLEAKQTDNR